MQHYQLSLINPISVDHNNQLLICFSSILVPLIPIIDACHDYFCNIAHFIQFWQKAIYFCLNEVNFSFSTLHQFLAKGYLFLSEWCYFLFQHSSSIFGKRLFIFVWMRLISLFINKLQPFPPYPLWIFRLWATSLSEWSSTIKYFFSFMLFNISH